MIEIDSLLHLYNYNMEFSWYCLCHIEFVFFNYARVAILLGFLKRYTGNKMEETICQASMSEDILTVKGISNIQLNVGFKSFILILINSSAKIKL